MLPYHKVETVWKRDPDTNYKTLIDGAWATPGIAYLRDNPWQCTEKVDGTNIRVMWSGPGSRVRFGGRSDDAQIHSGLIEVLQEWFTDATFTAVFQGGPVCLYGEGYGKKINGGGNYKPDGQSFVLFDVLVDGLWLERQNVDSIGKQMIPTNVPVVPVLAVCTLDEAINYLREAPQFLSFWGGFEAEGYIMRPTVEMFDRRGQRIITKVKRKDFVSR